MPTGGTTLLIMLCSDWSYNTVHIQYRTYYPSGYIACLTRFVCLHIELSTPDTHEGTTPHINKARYQITPSDNYYYYIWTYVDSHILSWSSSQSVGGVSNQDWKYLTMLGWSNIAKAFTSLVTFSLASTLQHVTIFTSHPLDFRTINYGQETGFSAGVMRGSHTMLAKLQGCFYEVQEQL